MSRPARTSGNMIKEEAHPTPIDVFAEANERLESGRAEGRPDEAAAALLALAEMQLLCELWVPAHTSAAQARELFAELGDQGREAEAARADVKAGLASESLDEALARVKEEQKYFGKEGKDLGEAMMLLSLSDVHMARDEPKLALQAATKASTALQRHQASMADSGAQSYEKRAQVLALHQIGEVQKAFNGAAEMLDVVRKAMPIVVGLEDPVLEARVYELKSHAYQVKGDSARAMEATKAGLELSRKAGDRLGEGVALNNTANAYLMRPDGAQGAMRAASEAAALCAATGDRREGAAALGELVGAYMALERMGDATRVQRRLLALAKERGDSQQIQMAEEGLAWLQQSG